jgi:hypothetical protein
MLLYIVYGVLTDAAREKAAPVRRAFYAMRLFIPIG